MRAAKRIVRVPNARRDFGNVRRSYSLEDDVRSCFGMAEDMCGSMDPDEIEDGRRMVRAVMRDVIKLVRARARGGS